MRQYHFWADTDLCNDANLELNLEVPTHYLKKVRVAAVYNLRLLSRICIAFLSFQVRIWNSLL